MPPVPKKWKVASPDQNLQKILTKGLNLSPLTAQLLINRGIEDLDNASSFISPTLKDLHNPFLMKDMDKATNRITKAIVNREKICIYGDYDVDGTTGAALLFLFLKEVGADVEAYIPERLREGYGLKEEVIKGLHEKRVGLIVTTDCGISSAREVLYANGLGIDVIITDHHEVPSILRSPDIIGAKDEEEVPQSLAVLNPKQKDCPFPFKGLAGVGVAFNLVIAVRATLRDKGILKEGEVPNLRRYLDLVALGTLADVVPLLDENRVFVRYGLEEIKMGLRPGIRALMEVSALKGELKSWNVLFQFVPRLNASGRLGDSQITFNLLIAEDFDKALSLAKVLDRKNTERREIENVILKEAIQRIEKDPHMRTGNMLILSSSDWHPGVIGIVASRLVETYGKPAVLIALKDGVGRGSVRSVKGVSILDLLRECEGFFEVFGGHSQAAGFTIMEDKVQGFSEALKKIASSRISKEDLLPEISLDAMVDLEELSEDVVKEIERLAPFGPSNPEPLLGLMDARIIQGRVVGNNHLKLTLKQKDSIGDAIGFNLGDSLPSQCTSAKLVFTPFIDEWNGKKNVRLKIKDIKSLEKS